MPIAYRCPSCQKKFALGDNLAGKSFTCWECGGVGDVPYVRPASSKSNDDDVDDVDDRPRRRRVKKKTTSNAGLVVLIIGGSLLLLIGLVAAIVYFGVQAMRNDKPGSTVPTAPPPPVAAGWPNPAPTPKPADESPESRITKEYSFTREKIRLGTPGRGLGFATNIPYTMLIEPEPDPLANMPQPKFGPKFGPNFNRPARYMPGQVMMVTLVEGRFQESMILGSFFWDKEGALEFRTMFGQLPANTAFFLAGPGKERISNVIRLGGGP